MLPSPCGCCDVELTPRMMLVFHHACCCSPTYDVCCVCAPCRAGVQLSKVEVKFNNLEVSADVNIGNRGMPTVANAFINTPLVSLTWLHTDARSVMYVKEVVLVVAAVCGLRCQPPLLAPAPRIFSPLPYVNGVTYC